MFGTESHEDPMLPSRSWGYACKDMRYVKIGGIAA